jgi:hypothetical protein
MNIRSTIAGCIVLLTLALLLPGCVKHVPALVRLSNAGFEQPLDSGWVQTVVNDSSTSGYIERSDALGQPDSGFAVRVHKFQKQFCSLSQTVPIETLGQIVRFWGRFRIGADVPCSPVASVVFNYLDSADNRLGRTLIYLPSPYNTWTDSDTQHLIRVTDTTGQWAQYSLNFQSELDSFLPHVPQERIKQLRVELYACVDYSG